MLEAFLCLDTTTSFQRPLLSSQLSPDVIVIDIRSHHYFLHSRIQSAINLSVPTMLLKRSSSTLEKLADMIAPASCQPIFNAWRSARRIIAYDVDSTALTSGSNILSLLRKFENEGFTGSLCFLQGGFSGISRVHPSLIDSRPLTPPGKDEESSRGVLHSCELPMAAFQQSNPFYDNIRQYLELSQGITERIPLELPEWVLERRDELPFEWLREIVRKARGEALEDLAMQFYRVELGEQKRLHGVMDHHSRESATENRAAKFPMKPIGLALNKSFFPYSITAGIEKGAKNRYRNIWPFEHARVRLIEPVDDDKSDYINASYIQPRGTTFRYIATQGPLESTFADFWTLCWEQNVSIIVMVTRQKEGNTVKCGNYWGDRNFGPLSLKLLKEEGPVHIDPPGENGGFGGYNFGIYDEHGKDKEEEEDTIIRRTFELRNSSYPEAPARKVTQLQYIGWPDLNVPKSPKHLLELIKELNKLRVEAKQHSIRMTGQKDESRRLSLGPVLVHCSAGVGRTGSFVMVDAILDAIRRETRTKMEQEIFRIKGRQEFKSDEDPPVFPPSHHSPPPLHPDDSGAIHLRYDRKPLTSADKRSVKKRRSDLGVFPSNMQSLPEEGAGRPITSPPSSLRNSASPRKKHHPNNSMTDLTAEKADILMAPLSRALESLRDLRRSAEPREGMSFSNAMELDNSDQATGAPSLASRASPPSPLSTIAEPIREVLEDMRQQRMSLCQSLRQYVFVHLAVVVGALEIVDEINAELVERGVHNLSRHFNAEGGLYRLGNRASIKRKQPSIGSLTDEGTTSRT
ncbi:protein-tyrosine phosphatase-like protein [Cantharellus anzutake]|uniref:protein-tyrosine phosphatase-like protein n=1 Tax=Cantharellus anzutake TaxID=1750568 RepID=UPI001903C305|nr:protein-tyrosine phosphatase-like protein [Cantharellus anzutake]KAF8330396.1 protein-tyrosine phosphatase-like protein [Cantharellus anzutake]